MYSALRNRNKHACKHTFVKLKNLKMFWSTDQIKVTVVLLTEEPYLTAYSTFIWHSQYITSICSSGFGWQLRHLSWFGKMLSLSNYISNGKSDMGITQSAWSIHTLAHTPGGYWAYINNSLIHCRCALNILITTLRCQATTYGYQYGP